MYLLDANVFITASRGYYGMDFCPAFWDWLLREEGVVASIVAIQAELREPAELRQWAASAEGLFLPPGEGGVALEPVEDWVWAQAYQKKVKRKWLGGPDATLVAEALARGATLVTEEKSAPGSVASIKVPDVCAGLGVRCIDTFAMLRELGARFVLAPAA